MIARLQLSDLHLGDPRSTLSNPEVAASVVAQLADISGGEVGKLILAGDVWEECVPGNVGALSDGVACSVREAVDGFFGPLFKSVKVGEVVWVPGNHDLSAWHWYCQTMLGKAVVTDYGGTSVDPGSWPFSILLPGFSSKLTVSYPIYWEKQAGADYPILVVTHGHLLDSLVLGWDDHEKYLALKALGCVRSNVPRTSEGAGSLKSVATATLDFCLALWKRYSPRDYVYSNHIMRRLDHPQDCALHQTFPRDGNYHLTETGLSLDTDPSVQGHTKNLPWFLETMIMDPYLPTPVGSLRQGEVVPAFTQPSCLTFGHDHLGHRKHVFACGVPFVCVDSGGWTSEYQGHAPHSHVLVWRAKGDVVPDVHFVRARTKGGTLL
jgi:hypothetical protein